MSTTELRKRVKAQIDRLPARSLQSAADYLTWLEERQGRQATEELMQIPGLRRRIAAAERSAAKHGSRHWTKVRDDV